MWTEEREAALRKGWDDGLSGSEIAKQRLAGVFTRAAVVGKAWRLGLAKRGRVNPPRPKATRSSRNTRHSTKHRKEPVVTKPEPVEPLNIAFLETRPNQCRAITDATRYAQRCCGHPVAAEGEPYCPAHKALHWQKGKAR